MKRKGPRIMEKAKIIVIDDDESICRLCQKIFEREGYAAAFFTQSLDAVDRLKKEHFDVALIDLSMPGKNGIEVIKDIKVISEDTSVLVMSAFPTVESVVESMKLGVCDYISKPFEIQDLSEKVRQCLQEHKFTCDIRDTQDLTRLYELSRAVGSSMEPSELLDHVLNIAIKSVGADGGLILLVNENSAKLELGHIVKVDNKAAEKIRKIGIEKMGKYDSYRDEFYFIIQDRDLEKNHSIKNLLTLPLKIGDEIVGLMCLAVGCCERIINKRDLRFLSIFAANLGVTVKELRLRGKIKEVEKIKSEFLNNVTHELWTPLTALQGGVELMFEGVGGALNDKGRALAEICRRNTSKIVSLVSDIVEFSKIQSGSEKYDNRKLSLNDLIYEILDELKDFAKEKSIDINRRLHDKLPFLDADPGKIKTALINVIGNAIKFTPKGGVVEIVSKPGAEDDIHITVTDSGARIPERERARVFESFYQVDGSASREHCGLGIGLAVTKTIVEKHNGKIWLESGADSGNSFHISLPFINKEALQ